MPYYLTYLLIVSFGLQSSSLHCQENCFKQNNRNIENGEILLYELDYHWGLIWVNTGKIIFTTDSTSSGYTLKGIGLSKSNWNWFYPVNSVYTSYTDLNLRPYEASRIGLEGKHQYNQVFSFDQNRIRYIEKNESDRVTIDSTFNANPCNYDVISAIYNFRRIDFEQYKKGEIIPIDILLDGFSESSYVKYAGKETWKHPKTKEKYECYVLNPKLIAGSVFKSGENMTVYVTADKFRVPLYIETDLIVGKAKIFLTKVRNTDFQFIE